jgi:histone H3/H4
MPQSDQIGKDMDFVAAQRLINGWVRDCRASSQPAPMLLKAHRHMLTHKIKNALSAAYRAGRESVKGGGK